MRQTDGRISRGKGVDLLINGFVRYKQNHPGELKLILAGLQEQDFLIPSRPDILYLGFVSERQKYALERHAEFLINPSRYESLSLVVIEAMALGVPVPGQ